ncbi:Tripeptidyl-peptidase 2 [Echinococcus granulosus]|uniref:Tripeptidyl-peptidase 2 n=1 Tax=Echinococcus granulosus TaxID=6210 RepID=W6U771_ECHGR|nr:Tripeptidyl-peptidase 2 [Echinococcus granulosus]EUB56221.1 Tripeptidyl-peptidase 2 [Echinococcus granulosus]
MHFLEIHLVREAVATRLQIEKSLLRFIQIVIRLQQGLRTKLITCQLFRIAVLWVITPPKTGEVHRTPIGEQICKLGAIVLALGEVWCLPGGGSALVVPCGLWLLLYPFRGCATGRDCASPICSTPLAMQSMIPKREIGALQFLKSNPEYDGRGTVIAIWDTGVDPTARGLQITSHGEPKIIDFIDASGSGDVNMLATFRITDSWRTITTLTGRVVSIPRHWKPADGLIRVGVKSAAEIFPAALLDQLRVETADRYWRPTIQRLCDYLKEASSSPPTQNISLPNPVTNEDSAADCRSEKSQTDRNGASSAVSFVSCREEVEEQEKEQGEVGREGKSELKVPSIRPGAAPNFGSFREWLDSVDKTKDLTALKGMERILAMLNDQQEYFVPVFDCFVFKGEDGDFVACVDVSPYEETPTNLADMPLLKDFSIGRQVAHFGNDTLLYFTVKILDGGNLLQIVTNCGSHGTHVAAIAAAYFPPSENCKDDEASKSSHLPEEASQNGVAPGAQIVSIKIADTHLMGMETNTSLLCALNWTTKLKCDIINYSFGEKSFLPNFGRIYTHLTQFVMHTNVAFVTSGGNGGPALGTVGSPGGAVDGLIGVAPLLFPKMMEYMYCQPTWNINCSNNKNNENTTVHSDIVADPRTISSDSANELTNPMPSAYTWGSRGPSPDGHIGLTVAACGAAVADVAAWKCSAFDLLNGSSMSSPSVAGGFALVLSALRQSEFQPCLRVPFILWRAAIFACAKPLSHLTPLEQGAGLFQVEATYEFLRDIIRPEPALSPPLSPVNQLESLRASGTPSAPADGGLAQLSRFSGWRLSCHVSGPGCIVENSKGLHSRGIWLRRGWLPFYHHCNDGVQSAPPKMSYTVHLEPQFCTTISAEFRRDFSLNLSVQVGYQQSNSGDDIQRPNWLHIAPFVMLASRSRTLPLFIDPTAFEKASTGVVEFNPPSRVHHTCVAFVNADSPQHEVLALLPITIQLPAVTHFDVDNGVYSFKLCGDFSYTQKVCRWFVRIPRGSTAGVLRLRRVDSDGDVPCAFTISIVQPTPLGSVQGTGYEVVHRRINLVSRTAGGVGLTGRNEPPSAYEAASADFVFAFAIEWVCDCVEITVAQHHGCDTPTACRISGRLEFHGLEVRPGKLVFHSCQTYFPVSLRSNFGLENIKFDLESKYWIQPVRPASSSRCYRKLVAYEEGSLGLPGVHCLSLIYNFHFKTDGAVFDFRRLTSLLYEADVVQVVYHLYDGCGRFKGAGSYQSIANPKYRFKLAKGPHQLIAMILYADTMKVSYTAKESDALDKLAHYPLLVRWPLAASNASSTCSASNSTSSEGSTSCQFVLEVSTSLATLALVDVDYERTCARFTHNSNGGCGDETVGEDGGGDDQNANLKSPKRDPIFGNLQKFPTVPGHLAAGECVTEVFGVVEENFAPYAISGSYFEGRVAYYDNRDLKNTVKLPLEVYVGPRDSGGATTPPTSKAPVGRGVFGLRARDVWLLRWIANAHFGLSGTSNCWVTPYETNSLSKSASSKERKKKNGGSSNNSTIGSNNKTKESGTNISHYVTALLNAGSDATNTDRAAVWKAVNAAMADLVTAAKTAGPDEHLSYLLPSSFTCTEEEDDDGGIGAIPLLVGASSSTVATAIAPGVEELQPGFWLAHLFVLHPQLPLLDALMRLAFELGPPTVKGGPSPAGIVNTKHPDLTHEKVIMDCASIAFPWMVEQLKRMGLVGVAGRLARQMPSRFSTFDYTLVLSRLPASAPPTSPSS